MKINTENINLEDLLNVNDYMCDCGKLHSRGISKAIIENNAVCHIPEIFNELKCSKAYVLSGAKTFQAAGKKVTDVLEKSGLPYKLHVIGPSP
ncbi:MAG: hypothetical protein MJ177_06745, partial [Clostridia bacterium]|nr:hypothetical protein [Clostridia bacterium]